MAIYGEIKYYQWYTSLYVFSLVDRDSENLAAQIAITIIPCSI